MSIETPSFEKRYIAPLLHEWKILEDYNEQFSMWSSLASILIWQIKNAKDPWVWTKEAEEKHKKNMERLSQLENSVFLKSIWLSVSSEDDGWIMLFEHGELRMQKIKFNVADPSKLKQFFATIADAKYKVEDKNIQEIFGYIFQSLSWQVINTYNIGSTGVDDEFLNFIQTTETITSYARASWVETWVDELENILVHSRKQCLQEYIWCRKLRLFPDQATWWLYPPSIWRDVPIYMFTNGWEQVIQYIQQAKSNPHAEEMLSWIITFWKEKMNELYTSMHDNTSLPEWMSADIENIAMYKNAIDEVRHQLAVL